MFRSCAFVHIHLVIVFAETKKQFFCLINKIWLYLCLNEDDYFNELQYLIDVYHSLFYAGLRPCYVDGVLMPPFIFYHHSKRAKALTE